MCFGDLRGAVLRSVRCYWIGRPDGDGRAAGIDVLFLVLTGEDIRIKVSFADKEAAADFAVSFLFATQLAAGSNAKIGGNNYVKNRSIGPRGAWREEAFESKELREPA